MLTAREQAHADYNRAVNTPGDVRALILADLFFLMVRVLGRADMDNDWCFSRCREVQASPDGHLDLWAREHYKSTIITVGKTIQDILGNPEITVGIVSYNQDIASSFLIQIKRIFEENEALLDLFPDVLWRNPAKEAPEWNTESLIVRRSSIPKESTVEALPLHKGVGKHFSLLVYDDVVTPESVTTPDMIKKTTENWQLSQNIGARGGKVRIIGTRYHAADTYSVILGKGGIVPRIYPATVDGTFEGEPVFLTREELAAKRRMMGPYIFACQMLQNPLADKVMGFKAEWFRTADTGEENEHWSSMNRYIVVDPAGEKKKGSDYTVMWVIGLGQDRHYHILDGIHDRLNLIERADALFRLHRKYMPVAVGYEKYGMQSDIEHIRDRMGRERYHFRIVALGGSMPKNDRIRRLIPLFEQGRVIFPYRMLQSDYEGRTHDLTRDFRDDEYLSFPVSAHDDMLDCLARIVDEDLGTAFPRTREYLNSLPSGAYRAKTEYDIASYGLGAS